MKRVKPVMIERFEEKLLLSAVFVTDPTVAVDSTHFHALGAASAAAGTGGTITILDGVVPDTSPVTLMTVNQTLQGDSRLPATTLARYSLTLVASGITLNHLAVGNLIINAGASSERVISCDLLALSEIGNTATGNGNNVFDSNMIHGPVQLFGNTGAGVATNDVFTHNKVVTGVLSQGAMTVGNDSGLVLTDNIIIADNPFGGGLQGTDTLLGITISRNQITGGATAMLFESSSTITGLFSDNVLSTANLGIGLSSYQTDTRLRIQGNDFRNNLTGVQYYDDAVKTDLQLDLGGGTLGSLGGNDFRGTKIEGRIYVALALRNAPNNAVLTAQGNIFIAGTPPVEILSGTIDTSAMLAGPAAFVTTLYEAALHRMPATGDVTYWTGVYNIKGQAAVVTGVQRSSEALSGIVDDYYHSYLGRGGDTAGLTYWVNILQGGGTLETVQASILGSVEFITSHNSDYVQSLYRTVLGRVADGPGISYFYNQLPTLGLTGVAAALVNSAEYRANFVTSTFARLLHRPAAAGDISGLATANQLTLLSLVYSSTEYFSNG